MRSKISRISLLGKVNRMSKIILLSASVFATIFLAGGVTLGQADAADPVLVGAGDIARSNGTGDEATAALLDGEEGTVFTLGDNAYDSGTATEFANCYEPTWGRHQDRTMPAVGNHEYATANASGYFGYFGAAAGDPGKGYYSYDRGSWHVIVLNSNCSKVGGCTAGSPQESWLEQDLAAHPSACTAAYFHHPRFSSGAEHGDSPSVTPLWETLYRAGADLVISGHDHSYERFAPQTPSGAADRTHGIRQFVVGTGGGGLTPFGTAKPNSEVRISKVYGVLKLTLHQQGYDWEFVAAPGGTVNDSGSGSCHDAPADTTVPAPTSPEHNLVTGSMLGTSTVPIKISWSATNEEGSVARYELQRSTNGGTFKGVALSSATSVAKTLQLSPGNAYQFRVRATDDAGNVSKWVYGAPFSLTVHQETSVATTYSGAWTDEALTSAYGGTLRYAEAAGSNSLLTTTGSDVGWVAHKGPNRGKAEVWVDGIMVTTVDLYAATEMPRKVAYSTMLASASSPHTLKVSVTGLKRTASSGKRVDVDAFVVLQ
jgi:hypothetical protein